VKLIKTKRFKRSEIENNNMVKKDKSAIIFSALSGMSIMMGVLFLLNNNPLGLLYILIGLGLFVYVWKG
jgi:hypothetical protein